MTESLQFGGTILLNQFEFTAKLVMKLPIHVSIFYCQCASIAAQARTIRNGMFNFGIRLISAQFGNSHFDQVNAGIVQIPTSRSTIVQVSTRWSHYTVCTQLGKINPDKILVLLADH